MQQINSLLFLLINATPNAPPALVFFAYLLAQWAIYLVLLALIIGWIRSPFPQREALFFAGTTAIAGLTINLIIANIWYHPRPFMLGIGTQLLAHGQDSSFPSDHTTVLFTTALALATGSRLRLWGGAGLLLAALVGWARVYLGVHWPFDILGSILVAIGVTALMRLYALVAVGAICQRLNRIYIHALNTLSLPTRLFPR